MNSTEKQEKFILAINQSNAGAKVLLFIFQINRVDRLIYSHQQFSPEDSSAKHDAEKIVANTRNGFTEILAKNKLNTSDIAVVSITNQRETILIGDRTTGKPIAKATVWHCQRGKALIK